ncbi:DHH family phosphoesterase [Bengtsoniella intestinalis]|uniref:single-stranded-DNA-specific exonuclease RecJ n=1 Tax=Bengtsoniella intestinalis TaxID=3073143 RepID=UPI00391F1915
MKYQQWNLGTPSQEDVTRLQEAGYAQLLSMLLSGRGITTVEQAAELLDRDEYLEYAPSLMKDMDKAVERIQLALTQGETMAVFGDYDVDGITSTCLLSDYLRSCGAKCLRHIPHRADEGYGLSCESIQMLFDRGARLLITVDCGITGFEEVEYANKLGMDVIITDHHACQETVPPALAVVNPHRFDCPYPFKHLAGVGVALKLVLALGAKTARTPSLPVIAPLPPLAPLPM